MFFFVPESEDQELEDWRLVLNHPSCRRLLRRILSYCDVIGTSTVIDQFSLAFNEGRRSVGFLIAMRIETAKSGALAKLMIESSDDRQAENAKTKRRKDDGD